MTPRYVVGFDVRVGGRSMDATARYLTEDDVRNLVRTGGWSYGIVVRPEAIQL
jgi:hypothetical protein